MMARLRTAARVLGWTASLIVLLLWATVLRPTTLGGAASYVLVTGNSMEPGMSDGDLAIVRARASYGVGDVVAFRIPAGQAGAGKLVIHRIIDIDANGFLLQGDNRDSRDLWQPSASDVLGVPVVVIPFAGLILRLGLQPVTLGLAAAAATMVSLLRPRRRTDEPAEDADPAPEPLPQTEPRPAATAASTRSSTDARGRRARAPGVRIGKVSAPSARARSGAPATPDAATQRARRPARRATRTTAGS